MFYIIFLPLLTQIIEFKQPQKRKNSTNTTLQAIVFRSIIIHIIQKQTAFIIIIIIIF